MSSFYNRRMSSATYKGKPNLSSIIDEGAGKHAKITSDAPRIPVLAEAVVTDIREESPNVYGFTMKINNPKFSFFAGQW